MTCKEKKIISWSSRSAESRGLGKMQTSACCSWGSIGSSFRKQWTLGHSLDSGTYRQNRLNNYLSSNRVPLQKIIGTDLQRRQGTGLCGSWQECLNSVLWVFSLGGTVRVWVLCTCVCVFMYIHVHVTRVCACKSCVWTCIEARSWCWVSSLIAFHFLLLRQGLSMSLDLTNMVRLGDQKAPDINLALLPQLWGYRHTCWGNLNSDLHAWVIISTLSPEPSPHPSSWTLLTWIFPECRAILKFALKPTSGWPALIWQQKTSGENDL